MSSQDSKAAQSNDLWMETVKNVADSSPNIVKGFFEHTMEKGVPTSDPLQLSGAFFEMLTKLAANPLALVESKMSLWQDYLGLWNYTTRRMLGLEAEPVATPARDDKRFKDEAWEEQFVFDYIKQSYLLAANWVQETVAKAEGLDDKTVQKVEFFTKQYVDAMAPTNFVHTNPKVLKETVESRGENLVKGLNNILHDLEAGKGKLQIRMTDKEAFELGKNIATTPGKVVYQNDMLQLLQYEPTTKEAHQHPLLVIPPWINKFYIMDLQPKNSLIKWIVDQGYTVFVISWVNPDETLAEKSFEDYMLEGLLTALEQIEKATGEKNVNVIGYCLGGTLLAATLSYMKAKRDNRIKSATYFTAMIDFSKPGDLGVFVDDHQIERIEQQMQETGYLEGRSMATTFNMLRSNDLIWSFVVNNYLLGKEPLAFDLLYWNSDSTRMPAAMHSYYLRNMYQQNLLKEPGGITLDGAPIDLSKVKTPAYFLSTKEDHIAPWASTFMGAQLFSGPVRFVLGGSGHIAGVVNPPATGKYGYWTNTKKVTSADAWFESAKHNDGSWWPDWERWVRKYAGDKIPAPNPGDGELDIIEDAPGSYVKVKATN